MIFGLWYVKAFSALLLMNTEIYSISKNTTLFNQMQYICCLCLKMFLYFLILF